MVKVVQLPSQVVRSCPCHKLLKVDTSYQMSTEFVKSQLKSTKYLTVFINFVKIVTTCRNYLKLPKVVLFTVISSQHKYLKVFMICHKVSQMFRSIHKFSQVSTISHNLSQLCQIVSNYFKWLKNKSIDAALKKMIYVMMQY